MNAARASTLENYDQIGPGLRAGPLRGNSRQLLMTDISLVHTLDSGSRFVKPVPREKSGGSEDNVVRILGLDIGSKRIGMAVSDELGLTAQGLQTVECKTPERDVNRIAQIAEQYGVAEIVVGVPYNMNGTEGPRAAHARAFIQRMGEAVSVPVRGWDERLSTVAAERILLEADMSRAKRRKVIDKVAAVIILQGYLDRRQYEGVSDP